MAHRPDLETHLLRKELVRAYYRQGLSVPDIIRRLDQNTLFSPHQTYNARYSAVLRLRRSVQREDSRRFRALQQDSEQALTQYIARQEYLYMKAVENGNYELAAKLSKDIARAFGVPTEEPIKIETDILTQMGAAFAMAEKKMAERRKQALPALAIDTAPRLLGNGKDKG